jgi:acyl carrier protein
VDDKLLSALASELEVEPAVLAPELRLDSLASWDSSRVLTIMVILGDTLGVAIGPSEMASLKTFGDIEALIKAHQKAHQK